MARLEVKDLRAGYGSLPVLGGISFNVEEGETAVLLGLNGAEAPTDGDAQRVTTGAPPKEKTDTDEPPKKARRSRRKTTAKKTATEPEGTDRAAT